MNLKVAVALSSLEHLLCHSPLLPEHVLLCQAHLHIPTTVEGTSLVLIYTIYQCWTEVSSLHVSQPPFPCLQPEKQDYFRVDTKAKFLGAWNANTVRSTGFGKRIKREGLWMHLLFQEPILWINTSCILDLTLWETMVLLYLLVASLNIMCNSDLTS